MRERILLAFSERAKRSGLRGVVMSELAAELRMSPNTLYQHFRSKKDLVTVLVEHWAQEVGASDAAVAEIAATRGAVEGMTRWAEAWATSVARYSPAFWEDLRRDHPEAFGIFRRELKRRKELGAAQLRAQLLPDVHPDVALSILDLILTRVSDPRFSDELGTTRRESIRTAIGIWARGALQNRGELEVLSG
ncbi:MAG: TetR/AcrR family transcriptional regulator [Myxococcales bacterium]